MEAIAEFTFRHPGLPLISSLEESGVHLEVEQAVAADPDEPVLVVWASSDDVDDFEAAVEAAGDRRLYRVAVSDDTPVPLYHSTLSARVADRDAFVSQATTE